MIYLFILNKSFHVKHHHATWYFSYADTSSNNNYSLSHKKKVLLKKKKERKYKNMGGLDQNPYINKNDTEVDYTYL